MKFDRIKEKLTKALPAIALLLMVGVPAALATYVVVLPIVSGGTGATTASGARSNLSAAQSGSNSDITSLSGLTTPLSVGQGGTGSSTASGARSNLSAAQSGANSDITSLSGLTTPLSVAQGGTGAATLSAHGVVVGNGTSAVSVTSAGTAGQVLKSNGASSDPTFQDDSPTYSVTAHSTASTAAAGLNQEDATGGAYALTLPSSPTTGETIIAKKVDSSGNAITVTRAGSQKIDGVNTYSLSSQYQSVSLIFDGTNWNIE